MFDTIKKIKNTVKYDSNVDMNVDSQMIEFEHLCDLYNHSPTPQRLIELEGKASELNQLFRSRRV